MLFWYEKDKNCIVVKKFVYDLAKKKKNYNQSEKFLITFHYRLLRIRKQEKKFFVAKWENR